MSQSSQHSIPDELLSAYIDGLVTEEERARIEAAMAADPEIAWQVETLRQTVRLLSELPPVPLPRSFVLTQAQVADVLMERQALASVSLPTPAPSPSRGRLFAFLQGGNPLWRNAAAVAAVLFLLLLAGEFAQLSPFQQSAPQYPGAGEAVAVVQEAPDASVEMTSLPSAQKAPPQEEARMGDAQAEKAPSASEATSAPALRSVAAMPAQGSSSDGAGEEIGEETGGEALEKTMVEAPAPEALAMEAPAAEEAAPAQEPMVGAASIRPSVEAREAGEVAPAGVAPTGAAPAEVAPAEVAPAPPATMTGPPAPAANAVRAEGAVPEAEEGALTAQPTPTRQPPTPTQAPPALAQAPAAQAQPAQEPAPAQASAPEEAPQAAQPIQAIPWEAVRWGLLGLTLLFALLWWRSRQGIENA